eukprot:c10597_g1_i1.p1 GENE.c10597_g1_i1~~c10597_g1_i1.p1  ORF type:complete len:1098 (-),score=359.91 c10597_g1_i1:307-3600(-)
MTDTLNMELVEYLQEMLNKKSSELEMTAEYGLQLSAANEKLTEENIRLVSEAENYRALVQSLDAKVATLKMELASKDETQGDSTDNAVATARTSRGRGMQAHLSEQESKQQLVKIKKLEEEVSELHESIKVLEDVIEEGKEREVWLKGQVSRLKERVAVLEEEQQRLIEEISVLQSIAAQGGGSKGGDVQRLEQALESALSEKHELSAVVDSLQHQLLKLQQQLDDMTDGGANSKVTRYQSDVADGEALGDILDGPALDDEGMGAGTPRHASLWADAPLPTTSHQEAAFQEIVVEPTVPEKSGEEIQLEANLELAKNAVSKQEVNAFCDFINRELGSSDLVGSRLPIAPEFSSLFLACRDCVILCCLVNKIESDAVDERVINKGTSREEAFENFRLCLDSTKSVGCSLPSVDPEIFWLAGDPNAFMGLLWALIKSIVLKGITVSHCPELSKVGLAGETSEELKTMPSEQLLIRWVQYHVKQENSLLRVKAFDHDFSDCEILEYLIPKLVGIQLDSSHPEWLPTDRLQHFLLLFYRKYPDIHRFGSVEAFQERNPRLACGFMAVLFKLNHGLNLLTDEERRLLEALAALSESEREAIALTVWINSLGIDDTVNNLFEELKDGLVLLKVLDKLNPGSVDWAKVAAKRPLAKFLKLQNTMYVIKLCKVMEVNIGNIDGQNIEEGHKLFTLSVVWQLMRYHIERVLQALSSTGSPITEQEVLAWANTKISESGKKTMAKSFKDPALRNGIFFLDLMNALKPGVVDEDLVSHGDSVDGFRQNAKYAISIARKLGASVFICLDDIVCVRPKWVFTFVAALMATTTPAKPQQKRQVITMVNNVKMAAAAKPQDQKPQDQKKFSIGGQNAPPQRQDDTNMKIVKLLESKVKELSLQNALLQEQNQGLCAEVGKLRAANMGKFMLAARQQQSNRGDDVVASPRTKEQDRAFSGRIAQNLALNAPQPVAAAGVGAGVAVQRPTSQPPTQAPLTLQQPAAPRQPAPPQSQPPAQSGQSVARFIPAAKPVDPPTNGAAEKRMSLGQLTPYQLQQLQLQQKQQQAQQAKAQQAAPAPAPTSAGTAATAGGAKFIKATPAPSTQPAATAKK